MSSANHAVNMLTFISEYPMSLGLPLIDIESCSEWWSSYDEQLHGKLTLTRYHCVRPVFGIAVLHAPAPAALLIDGKWQELDPEGQVSDVFVVAHEPDVSVRPTAEALPPADHWVVIMRYLVGKGIALPCWETLVPLLPDGAPDPKGQLQIRESPEYLDSMCRRDVADATRLNAIKSELHPVFFALALMHAKNVKVEPTQLPRSVRRHHHVPPQTVWKTLVIDGLKREVARKQRPGDSGVLTALHLVRGSFATYSPEAPLFGRVAGTFWRPAHVKGTKAAGVIHKNYVVKVKS